MKGEILIYQDVFLYVIWCKDTIDEVSANFHNSLVI